MKRFLYSVWSKFLTMFGDIKIFRFPLWLVYDPDDFQVTGQKVLEILDLIEPGDILLRGYNKYADGKLIEVCGIDMSKSVIGGGWSHGAIYAGKNKVIHAVAEGVSETNIIDFTRCDRICIFRPAKMQAAGIRNAKKFLKQKVAYDFGYTHGASALYCFELAALSYPKLRIPKFNMKKLFGLLRKDDVYLAQSFLNSPDCKLVFCWNPKYEVDITQK